MMKREIIWSLSIFITIFAAFFGIDFVLLSKSGFTAKNYMILLIFIFPAVGVIGYIFLTQVLEKQLRHEKHLEHLVRETLHEINLPLATIDANLQMLLRSDISEKDKKRLQRIASAQNRLKKLYKNLAYELKREISPIKREIFDLDILIRDRVSYFKTINRNSFELKLSSLNILADKIGLEQTIDNIIENAMKYSEAGSTIKIVLDGNVLNIIDYGRGMDENEILRIYERYYQADREISGEGIGLNIVKRYCDEESIGLRIDSKKGRGTTVSLDFSKKLYRE